MIPYIEWKTIEIGPLTLYVWGLFVALGFLLAAYVAGKRINENDGNKKVMYDLAALMMVSGIIGGRLGYVLFYNVGDWLQNPLSMLNIWDGGLSFFGGLFASAAVGIWFLRRKKVDVWQYADAAIFGLPFGLWIGRIGCFLIHDHPGTATDFVLGVEYPDGVVRHDHGLYLSINGFLMAMLFLWLARKKRPVGTYVGVFAMWYGLVRMVLDTWRVADVRYFGLTPAQYFGAVLAVFGVVLLYKLHKRSR